MCNDSDMIFKLNYLHDLTNYWNCSNVDMGKDTKKFHRLALRKLIKQFKLKEEEATKDVKEDNEKEEY